MKLILKNGTLDERPVMGALTGLPILQVAFDAEDVKTLAARDPKRLHEWMQRLSMRFPPSGT